MNLWVQYNVTAALVLGEKPKKRATELGFFFNYSVVVMERCLSLFL